MLFRNANGLAVFFMLGGLGIVAWFGPQWNELPTYSAADIENSTELNLAIELERMGPHLRPEGERLEQLRVVIRSELEGSIYREREQVERWIGAGLILFVIGFGQWAAFSMRKPAS